MLNFQKGKLRFKAESSELKTWQATASPWIDGKALDTKSTATSAIRFVAEEGRATVILVRKRERCQYRDLHGYILLENGETSVFWEDCCMMR